MLIGPGRAGERLAVEIARAGLHTALPERSEFGGACVDSGEIMAML